MLGRSPEIPGRTDRTAAPARGGGEGDSAENCALGVGDRGEMVRRMSLHFVGKLRSYQSYSAV